jgi:hypothetical protein
MPETGLEPAHLAAPDPKSGASTNFATPAFGVDVSDPMRGIKNGCFQVAKGE